jgi:hypothetical protein
MRWIDALAPSALALLVAGAALAQDGATTSPPTPPVAGALRDADAREAVEHAKRARLQAACLNTAAAKVDAAARQLDAATDDNREARFTHLAVAELELEACGQRRAPKRSGGGPVQLGATSIESPLCAPSDPLCSDIVSNDTAPVVDSLQSQNPRFRVCYEKARKATPDLHGKLALRVVLAETRDGAASAPARVHVDQDTMSNKQLTECVIGAVDALRFDKTSAGSVVRFSLGMQPGP